MINVSIIIKGNVARGKRKQVRNIEAHFRQHFNTRVYITAGHDDATRQTIHALQAGCDYIVATGGDGTVNEVVNGIMQFDEKEKPSPVLAVLPLGTGNDLSRSLNYIPSIENIIKLIKNHQIQSYDVVRTAFHDGSSRYFINIADIGIGGHVVNMVNKSPKILGSGLAFILSTIRGFLSFRHKEVEIRSDSFHWKGKIITSCFANGKYFGSGLGIAPMARMDDGNMHITIVGKVNVLEFIKYLPKLKKCHPIQHPGVHYHVARECQILQAEKGCFFEMDGELSKLIPSSFTIAPNSIRFISS